MKLKEIEKKKETGKQKDVARELQTLSLLLINLRHGEVPKDPKDGNWNSEEELIPTSKMEPLEILRIIM